MKKGHTLSDIAVYLPTEDAWTSGIMPKEKQFIWAWGNYEMRYVYFPDELISFNPVWINYEFLEKGSVKNGIFRVGNAEFKILYFDSKYVDYKVIVRLAELADEGLQIVLKQIPEEPGINVHTDYITLLDRIRESRPDISSLPESVIPFMTGNEIPRHWCRVDGETIYIFFPNPKSDRIKFPLEYGQSLNTAIYKMPVTVNIDDISYNINLEFKPYQSLLYKLQNGKAEQIDIEFIPSTPSIRERPAGYEAPWLVR